MRTLYEPHSSKFMDEVTCPHCLAELAFNKKDVFRNKVSNRQDERYIVFCPWCSSRIPIRGKVFENSLSAWEISQIKSR